MVEVWILQNSKPVSFKKGEKLIVQGASDDCTYFILSGQVEVKINGLHIDTRVAPQIVGEMAAKRAGAARTADVIATSSSVEALSVSGSEFRAIMWEYEDFRKNLDNEIDELSRKKISQLGEKGVSRGLSWTVISAAVGVIGCVVAALASFLMGLATADVLLFGVSVGLLGFVATLLMNPDLRYRNLASAAGFSLIGLVVYGSLSFALTIKGDNTDLPLIDFSIQTEQKLGMFLVGAIGGSRNASLIGGQTGSWLCMVRCRWRGKSLSPASGFRGCDSPMIDGCRESEVSREWLIGDTVYWL